MLRSGWMNRSLKVEVASCCTTGGDFGLEGPSSSIPDSPLDPLRDDRSLNRFGVLLEELGEAGVSKKKKKKRV